MQETDLVIDGGNVVKYGDRIIMTDKVLKENPAYTEQELIKRIENEFECEICLIPWDRYEFFGHSDGMVRFIDGDNVLLNNYVDIDRGLRDRILSKLYAHRFNVEELHYGLPRPSKQSWAYLNFLQVRDHIFVPGLGIREDAQALEQIQEHYPNHKVIRIPDCQNLVRDGGALNCISWTIKGINDPKDMIMP